MVLGTRSGGAAISAGLADFVFVVDGIAHLSISGPGVVKALNGEDASIQELGKAHVHMDKGGISHFIAKSEEESLRKVKHLFSFLPSNSREEPSQTAHAEVQHPETEVESILGDNQTPYDMKEIIHYLLDGEQFLKSSGIL